MSDRIFDILCAGTETKPEDWEAFDGPDSGVGVGYWWACDARALEAYVNVDQHLVSISVTDPDGGEVLSAEFERLDG